MHHAMPSIVVCGLRFMTASRSWLATTRPGILGHLGDKVEKSSIRTRSNHQATCGLYDTRKATGTALRSGVIRPRRVLRALQRVKIQTTDACRSKQLRCLSTRPDKDEQSRSLKKYAPARPASPISPISSYPLTQALNTESSQTR